MIVYLLSLVLFSIGIYCIVRKRNIIKIIIGVIISEYAVNLFFILLAYKVKGRAPLYSKGMVIENMVDALPQAVVLTSILIGLATSVILIVIALKIFDKYKTFDITKIKDLKG